MPITKQYARLKNMKQKIISSIPQNITKYFAIILSVIFIFDLFFSVKSLIDFNKYIYKIKTLGTTLEEKFHKIKNGKGIAYTVPLTSTIGVAIYQFLSNTQSR